MLTKSHNRIIFGAFIGAFGGSSFVMSVFPIAVGLLFEQITGVALLFTLYYTIPLAAFWAAAGALTGWLSKMREGAVIMGLCGAISGSLVGATLMSEPNIGLEVILSGAVVGLAYGIPAGLLMGGAFRRPTE